MVGSIKQIFAKFVNMNTHKNKTESSIFFKDLIYFAHSLLLTQIMPAGVFQRAILLNPPKSDCQRKGNVKTEITT